jgi:hypothetical protein
LSKDGRSQLVKLANNPSANAAEREKAVHAGRYASGLAFRQAVSGAFTGHDPAATSPGIVPKRANFSRVNPRV